MADENQQLQEEMNRLRESLQNGGMTAKEFADALRKSEKGLDAFADATAKGAKQVAVGMGSFALQVGQGDTNFKSLNKVVDVASDALSGMAKAIPFAGEAVAAGLKAAAEGAKFMLDQMDQTTKAFNDLGRVGALTASGMSGLQKQFVQSGLTLNSFSKIVGENSMAMARFRGMTGDGAEEFTKITGALTQGDMSLRRIGMSADQIGESTAAFVTQQTRLGRSQAANTNDLISGTKQYALELDTLSKITGQSREAIQKQQDAVLSESRFRANYEELMAQGRTKEAKSLMDLQTRMNTFGAEMGQGTRDLISGAANTDAARKMMASTGGAAQDIIMRLKDGSIDQNQAQIELQAAMKRNRDAQMQNAKFVDRAASAYQDFSQVADFTNADFSQGFEKARKTQDAQLKGQDKLTEDTVKAQANMEQMNREIQKLGFTFLPNAATAVNKMTDTMKKFVQYVNEKVLGEAPEAPAAPVGVGIEFGAAGGAGGGTGNAAVDAAVGAVASDAEIAAARKSVVGPAPAPPAPGSAAPAPAAPAPGSAAPAPVTQRAGQQDLAKMGLKIKQGDVQAQDATISSNLIELAKKVQSNIPGFAYFSGFNDKFHQENSPASKHTQGLAMDFALAQKPSKEEGARIVDMLKQMGAISAIDEYNSPSAKATGGHIHAQVSAASGAILSGPKSGYTPNLVMHGTEAVVPLNTTPEQGASGLGINSEIMQQQLDRLDDLVSVMKNQLDVSTKIMRYSS
jgi:hypothetical protein